MNSTETKNQTVAETAEPGEKEFAEKLGGSLPVPEPSARYWERLAALVAEAEAREAATGGTDMKRTHDIQVHADGAVTVQTGRRRTGWSRLGWAGIGAAVGAMVATGAGFGWYYLSEYPRLRAARETPDALLARAVSALNRPSTIHVAGTGFYAPPGPRFLYAVPSGGVKAMVMDHTPRFGTTNGSIGGSTGATAYTTAYTAEARRDGSWTYTADTSDGPAPFCPYCLPHLPFASATSSVHAHVPWNGHTRVALAERLVRLQAGGSKFRVSRLADGPVNGLNSRRLLVDLPPEAILPEGVHILPYAVLRLVVSLDPATSLPRRIELEANYQSQWNPVYSETYSYGGEPAFARTGEVALTPAMVSDAGWKAALETNPTPVSLPGQSFTYRGVEVGGLGDVYVFYSLPAGVRLPEIELHDSSGRKWTQITGGRVGRRSPELVDQWTFGNGETLCVAWFRAVPFLATMNPPTSRTLPHVDVRFRLSEDQAWSQFTTAPRRWLMNAIGRESCYDDLVMEAGTQLAVNSRLRAHSLQSRENRQRTKSGAAEVRRWQGEATAIEDRIALLQSPR